MNTLEKSNTIGNKLTWMVVKNLEASIQFYVDVVGYKVISQAPEYGWAELSCEEGAVLGLAEESPKNPIKSGMNAVITVTVKDIEVARQKLVDMGAVLMGDVEEVPGHVRMQTFQDLDGNTCQLAQML